MNPIRSPPVNQERRVTLEPLKPDMNYGEAKINIPGVKEIFWICDQFVNAESAKRFWACLQAARTITSDAGFFD
jgi:hypothetical protein